MMMTTPFTQLVGCSLPIQLAPMGGICTPELVSAVCGAGGMGMIGTAMMPPDVLGCVLDDLESIGAAPLGVNFLMPLLDVGCVEVAAGRAMGTRFVATVESGANPRYKEMLVQPGAADTVMTTAFSVMWPRGPEPHRVLRSSIEAAERSEADVVGEIQAGPERLPLPRFAVPPPLASTTGDIDAMAMYAGESVAGIDAIEPAAEIVRRVCDEAGALLGR